MSVFNLVNKVTLGELSQYSPHLSTFNGSLALTWGGTDGQFNMLLSTDGITWGSKRYFAAPAAAPGAVSSAPAMGAGGSSPAAPAQLIAWRGGNSALILDEVLNPGQGNSNSTGQFTDHAPSLSANFLAWTGSGNPQLNVATCQLGQSGLGYVPSVYISGAVTSSESSDAGPCLCDFQGETLIGWRGSGNYTLNVAQVVDSDIVSKHVIGEYSDYGPALAGVGSNLYMAWTGSGNPQLNIMSSPNGYTSFGGKAVLSDASDSAPSLASYNSALYLAWRGSGNNNLNVAQVMGPGLGGL